MVDLAITAANVQPGTNLQVNNSNNAGAAITAGQAVYLNGSSLWVAGDATTTTKAAVSGIALNNAANGQPLVVAISGQIVIGATVVAGQTYVLSATAGGGNVCPVADLVAGNVVTYLGYAVNTTTLQLMIKATGIAHG